MPIDTPTLSPSPPHPSLAVSLATRSETRAPPRSPPSSRRHRSRTYSAPPPPCLLFCQCPLTHLRTLFPPLLCTFPPASEREHPPSFVPFRTHSFLCPFPNTFLPLSLSEHIPSLNTFFPWSTELPTLARKRTRPFHITIHMMLPSILRRVDRGHVLLSDGWVARTPAPISTPCDLPVTAWSTTDLTTRPRRPSKTPLAAASASASSKRPRCATPLPGVPTPDSLDSPDSPPTASPTSPSSDSARASPTASPTPPPACPPRSLKHHLQHSGHLAHARAPRAAALCAALKRACERPWLPPRPTDAAAPRHGAVGRVRGACGPALQGALAARVCAHARAAVQVRTNVDGWT